MSHRRAKGSRPGGGYRAAGTERTPTDPQIGLKGSAFGLITRRACPDCAAEPERGEWVHASSCPMSRAMDAMMDDDARWFRDHPGERTRRRPVTWAEVTETELTLGWRPVGSVIVLELAPGLRSRYLSEGGTP